MTIRAALQRNLPGPLLKELTGVYLRVQGFKNGVKVQWTDGSIDVVRGADVVRLNARHALYVPDVVQAFDYYFSSVASQSLADGRSLVDFSRPASHVVKGFDLHGVTFPSLAEPICTAQQYLDFAGLSAGMTAIDLGAYSGLTSILMQEAVGPTGRVVAVDADTQNLACIALNFEAYAKVRGVKIALVHGAAWEDDGGIDFSCEGNMGSSAVSIVGSGRGTTTRIASFSLSDIARIHSLDRVDFIKCDIEGAEKVVFKDAKFFAIHRPRIVIEAHKISGLLTSAACIADLERVGYGCKEVSQPGSDLPLIECAPAEAQRAAA